MNRHLSALGILLVLSASGASTGPGQASPTSAGQAVTQRPLDVPARALPVPDTLSPAMQAIVGAPLSPTWNVVPKTLEEWKALSAPTANRGLPALRERFGIASEAIVVNGAQAYLLTPRTIPPENRDRLLVH